MIYNCVWHGWPRNSKSPDKVLSFIKESRCSSQKKKSGREHGANFITSNQIHILDTIKFHAFAKLVIEFLEVILIVSH